MKYIGIVIVITIVVVCIVGAAIVGIVVWKLKSATPYYAVYTTSGDLYFGKLSRFPKYSLSNVWYVRRADEQSQGPSLVRFADAVWGPQDRLEINKNAIVWTAKLDYTSDILPMVRGEQSAITQWQQQMNSISNQAAPSPTPSPTP